MTENNTPTHQPPPPSNARPATQPARATSDQIKTLIAALDDPNKDQYAYAEDELIRLGPQAVPALIEVLNDQSNWVRAYRAAEALGQIGDGRASRPLITALNHPNSNVRWGVVRAIAKVGDSRAILPLRRIARTDRSKTSWGESVASAAQVALTEMGGRSAVLRMSDPIKIALLVAVALFALWFATSKVNAFRAAVDDPTNAELWGQAVTPIIPTPAPEPTEEPETDDETASDDSETATVDTTPSVEATNEADAVPVTALVTSPTANIRPQPNTQSDPIGTLKQGDVVEIVEQRDDWFRIVLPDDTGTGWVAASVLGPPSGPIPTLTPTGN